MLPLDIVLDQLKKEKKCEDHLKQILGKKGSKDLILLLFRSEVTIVITQKEYIQDIKLITMGIMGHPTPDERAMLSTTWMISAVIRFGNGFRFKLLQCKSLKHFNRLTSVPSFCSKPPATVSPHLPTTSHKLTGQIHFVCFQYAPNRGLILSAIYLLERNHW